jgi:hypothetical protein
MKNGRSNDKVKILGVFKDPKLKDSNRALEFKQLRKKIHYYLKFMAKQALLAESYLEDVRIFFVENDITEIKIESYKYEIRCTIAEIILPRDISKNCEIFSLYEFYFFKKFGECVSALAQKARKSTVDPKTKDRYKTLISGQSKELYEMFRNGKHAAQVRVNSQYSQLINNLCFAAPSPPSKGYDCF